MLLIRESSNGRNPGFEPVNMGSTPISCANVGLSTMAVRQVVSSSQAAQTAVRVTVLYSGLRLFPKI